MPGRSHRLFNKPLFLGKLLPAEASLKSPNPSIQSFLLQPIDGASADAMPEKRINFQRCKLIFCILEDPNGNLICNIAHEKPWEHLNTSPPEKRKEYLHREKEAAFALIAQLHKKVKSPISVKTYKMHALHIIKDPSYPAGNDEILKKFKKLWWQKDKGKLGHVSISVVWDSDGTPITKEPLLAGEIAYLTREKCFIVTDASGRFCALLPDNKRELLTLLTRKIAYRTKCRTELRLLEDQSSKDKWSSVLRKDYDASHISQLSALNQRLFLAEFLSKAYKIGGLGKYMEGPYKDIKESIRKAAIAAEDTSLKEAAEIIIRSTLSMQRRYLMAVKDHYEREGADPDKYVQRARNIIKNYIAHTKMALELPGSPKTPRFLGTKTRSRTTEKPAAARALCFK